MERCSMPTGRALTRTLLLALLLAAGPVLLAARPAQAARTFVVTTVGDGADANLADDRCDVSANPGLQCTLRAAIQEANNTPGPDAIAFNLPGGGVKRIRPNSELPEIAEEVTIDGYTQPGAKPNTAAVGTNAVLRIELDGVNAGFVDALRVNGPNSVVRGLVIGRFGDDGIVILADGVRVIGCFVGTNAAGTLGRGNGYGVYAGGANTSIGAAASAARNLISGNAVGVQLGFQGTGARVVGNLIGTTMAGTAPLPNDNSGILSLATNTYIGGNSAAEANVIQFNGGDGVEVASNGTRNRILRNSIGANGGIGIDLGLDGVTPNDAGDADAGANIRQNFPVITAASSNLVRITLNSTPNKTFFVRLYSNPGSGNEGIHYHGTFAVSTGPGGNTAGPENNLTPNPPIPAGRSVTATATDGDGNTSEFSAPKPVA